VEPNHLAGGGLSVDEDHNTPMREQTPKPKPAPSLKTAVIVIAVVEAIAMVPLILHLANK
jgi:hypothetical protein